MLCKSLWQLFTRRCRPLVLFFDVSLRSITQPYQADKLYCMTSRVNILLIIGTSLKRKSCFAFSQRVWLMVITASVHFLSHTSSRRGWSESSRNTEADCLQALWCTSSLLTHWQQHRESLTPRSHSPTTFFERSSTNLEQENCNFWSHFLPFSFTAGTFLVPCDTTIPLFKQPV